MAELEVSILARLQDLFSGPAGKIRQNLQGLRSDADRLSYALSPLRFRISSFVSLYAAISLSRDALDQAEQQVLAERALIQALRGRTNELEKIKASVKELSQQTGKSGDDLLRLSARLVDLNVSFSEIPRYLRIATDTSARLGIEVDSIVEGLGQLQTTGILPASLTKRVPELRALKDGVISVAEAVDILEKKFAGAAAADANNVFGQIKITAEETNDDLERIGNQIAPVQLKFAQLRREVISTFAKFLESDAGKGFIKFLELALEKLASMLGTIIKFAALIAAVRFVVWLAPITLLLAKFIAIGFIVKELVFFVAELFGLSDDLQRAWDQITASATDFVSAVGDGTVDIEYTLDRLSLKIKTLTASIKLLWVIFKEFGTAAIKTILGGFGLIGSTATLVFVTIADEVVDLFFGITRAVLGFVDNITNGLADALSLLAVLPGVEKKDFNAVRTDLKSTVSKDFTGLDTVKAAAEEGVKESFDLFSKSFGKAAENVRQFIEDETNEMADAIQEAELGREQRRSEGINRRRAEAEKEVQDRLALETALTEEIAALERQLAEIRLGINRESAETLNEIRQRELALLFEQRSIGGPEFIARSSEIALSGKQKELDLLVQQGELLEKQIALRRDAEGADADVRAELNALIELRTREQALVIDLRNREIELDQIRGQVTSRIIEDAEKARSAYDDAIQRAQELASTGLISNAVASQQQIDALVKFRDTIAEIQASLGELRLLPGFEDELRAAYEQLQKIADLGQSLSTESFWEGFVAGSRQATESVRDLGTIGVNAGRELTDQFANGVVGAFKSSSGGFKEFATNFLQLIADMIIKTLVLRAVSAALGFFGGGGSGVSSTVDAQGFVEFAEGGPVPGPDVNRDVVPAMLSPREWVIRRDAAMYYGDALLAALNARLIPRDTLRGFAHAPIAFPFGRFAEGGQVSGFSGSPMPVYVPPDDVALERLLKGGRRAFRRFSQAERTE